MPMEQLSFEDEAVNRIRSIYRTVERYHKTSMALHNRPVDSAKLVASQRLDEVYKIASDHPESKQVQRWTKKFEEFVYHAKLVDLEEF